MQRHELEKIITESGFQKGGTKEACLKVEEVLRNRIISPTQLTAPGSPVNMEEFVQAIKVMLAALKPNADQVPTLYHCDEDCAYIFDTCPGEVNCILSSNANQLCPYYATENK